MACSEVSGEFVGGDRATVRQAGMVVAPSTRARRIEASKAPRDEELRLYLALLLVAGAVVSTSVWAHESQHGEGAVRAGVFEVTSVVTTTG